MHIQEQQYTLQEDEDEDKNDNAVGGKKEENDCFICSSYMKLL